VIINVTSVVGPFSNFGQITYTKAGFIGLKIVWAGEQGRKGGRVNTGGYLMTEMIAWMPANVLDDLKNTIPFQSQKQAGLPGALVCL